MIIYFLDRVYYKILKLMTKVEYTLYSYNQVLKHYLLILDISIDHPFRLFHFSFLTFLKLQKKKKKYNIVTIKKKKLNEMRLLTLCDMWQIAFLSLIYPSLVLTYAGQTAYLIKNPNDHEDGFYKFIPKNLYWPMFVIASLAAIVASQSLISATFSVIKQSVVLDYFPRIKIVHTSSSNEGQVYSPETNYTLMVLCVAVILIFGDGKEIGNAFGMSSSLLISCVLYLPS